MIRFNFAVRSMKLKPGSIEVVSSLKSKGCRLALISNSAPEAPIIWKGLPFAGLFDVSVFSCQVGLQKPDPRIFRLALEQLAMKPEECLYIGDRPDTDLFSAARMGMSPVLIRVPYETVENAYRIDEEEWNGTVISSLKEVLDLVK